MKLSVVQLDLRGKRVFLRADFNVPLDAGAITDDARIRAALPTIDCCVKNGASVILASHLGRPKGQRDARYSLKPVAFRLEALLGRPVPLAPDCIGRVCEALARSLEPGQLLLLENLRFHSRGSRSSAAASRCIPWRSWIASMIATARASGRKVGICGHAPSDYPEFAQFLVRQGIDSISLNPDAVLKTTVAVLQMEREVGGTEASGLAVSPTQRP
jgi:phosphoglycerate kinase